MSGLLIVCRNGQCNVAAFIRQPGFCATTSRALQRAVAGALGAFVPLAGTAYTVGVPIRDRALMVLGSAVLAAVTSKNLQEATVHGMLFGSAGAAHQDGVKLSEWVSKSYDPVAKHVNEVANKFFEACSGVVRKAEIKAAPNAEVQPAKVVNAAAPVVIPVVEAAQAPAPAATPVVDAVPAPAQRA